MPHTIKETRYFSWVIIVCFYFLLLLCIHTVFLRFFHYFDYHNILISWPEWYKRVRTIFLNVKVVQSQQQLQQTTAVVVCGVFVFWKRWSVEREPARACMLYDSRGGEGTRLVVTRKQWTVAVRLRSTQSTAADDQFASINRRRSRLDS